MLDTGGTAWTTDEGRGRVAIAVYPWEVSLARTAPDDSARQPRPRRRSRRSSRIGNRVRVRVGPLAAEVTTASAERLGLREGEVVVASFKATAARLLPLA